MRRKAFWLCGTLLAYGLVSGLLFADSPAAPAGKPDQAAALSPAQLKFFEEKVRPILAENCLGCHGEKKQKGGLRLDSHEGLFKGGKDGVVVVPGKPSESKLIVAVSYE